MTDKIMFGGTFQSKRFKRNEDNMPVKCQCGKLLYENDVPCHGVCRKCGELIPNDTYSIPHKENTCVDCYVDMLRIDHKFFDKHLNGLRELISSNNNNNIMGKRIQESIDLLESFNN